METRTSYGFAGNRVAISLGLGICLFAAIILQNTLISTASAYAVISVVYVMVVVGFISLSKPVIPVKRVYVILFLAFASIACLRTLIDPSISSAIRVGSLLTFTAANLFVLPRVIPFRNFCFIAGRLSTVLILIGFLPYVGLPLKIGFIDLSLWGAQLYWYPDFAPITSVFVNPNQLGSLALVGTITALVEWRKYEKTVSKVIFGVNVVGLLFTNYRTGWLAFMAALGLFTVYSLWGRKQLVLATVGGISAMIFVLMMAFNIIPGPDFLTEFSLNGRRALWSSSVHALKSQFIVGYNFGGVSEIVGNPHNSYLRMFVAFGVGGGLLYLILVIGTVIGSARRATKNSAITLVMLLISFCVIQLFNQLAFVGVSMRSTLIAMGMGYYIAGEY